MLLCFTYLLTHFKALLFLGSGSVIHAFKDEQNINNMGGVWKKLPYTYGLMIIGTLALTGFPFLSGFYSKDAIIEFAYLKGCLLYTSPSPRDRTRSRMPSSA